MSWEYFLVPRAPATSFPTDALRAMNAWWEGKPICRRTNGNIVLCRDTAYRDWVVREGRQDAVDANVEVVRIAPERVTLSVMGAAEMLPTLYAFLVYAQSLFPSDVRDDTERTITAEDYLRRQGSVNHSVPGSDDDDA